MKAMDLRVLGVALLSIFLGATGQFLFRVGMMQYGKITVNGVWKHLFHVLLTPAIFLGFICFGISSILWLAVISRWELSAAYPLVAFGYVLAIGYGSLFLHETLNLSKVLGSGLILAGVLVLGWARMT